MEVSKIVESVKKIVACNCESLPTFVWKNCKNVQHLVEPDLSTLMAKKQPDYIPDGFTYLAGSITTHDYMIRDNAGNIFTWIPGRTVDGTFVSGFFVSTFEISEGKKQTPKSVPNALPWTKISYNEAKSIAKKFPSGRLITNLQYDSICAMLRSEIGTQLVDKDSSTIGNYCSFYSDKQKKLTQTGNYFLFGLSNIAGNCWIYTEFLPILNYRYNNYILARGGSYMNNGKAYPISSYKRILDANRGYNIIGFRIVI